MSANKTEQSNQLNLVHSFRSIYYFSRCFGFMPFSVIFDSKRNVLQPRVRLFDVLWFVVFICYELTLAYFTFKMWINNELPNLHTLTVLVAGTILLILSLTLGALIVVMDFYNRQKLVDIVNKFCIFDEEISIFAIHFNYRSEQMRIFIFYSIPLSVSIVCFLVLYGFGYLMACRIFQLSTVVIPLISFTVLLRSLHRRFSALNSLLRNKFLNGNRLELSASVRKQDAINTIKFVGRQHSNLIDIMDYVNSCFSFQTMVNIAGTFIYSVLASYVLYVYIIRKDEAIKTLFSSLYLWVLNRWILMLAVIYNSDMLAQEGDRISKITHDIINQCNDVEIALSLTQLSQQVQHHRPIATCKLFIFDWTLIFTMGAAITTYLMILLNFESSRLPTDHQI